MRRSGATPPLIFGHRGASKVAPENTLPAFEAALRLGADGVELDVQYSSDSKLVIFHNTRLDKTSNGSGRVTAHPLDELRSLDAGSWFGPQFAGTRIPTLDEVLDLLKGKLLVNIELKTFDMASKGLGADVVRVVRDHGMADEVVLSSFNPFALRTAKQAGPEIAAGLLLALDLPGWTRWGLIRRHSRADGLHPELAMVDAAFVAAARKLDLPVRAWTVNEAPDIRRMIDLGVDAIITDDLALAVPLVAQTGRASQQRS